MNHVSNPDVITGTSCSGSLQLSLLTLSKLIICSSSNNSFQLKNVIEFDILTNDPIYLEPLNKSDLQNLIQFRNENIEKFESIVRSISNIPKIPKKIFQTWETKSFEIPFQKIVDSWILHNPEYEYSLYDSTDRENFIRENFGESVYKAYCKIIPNAFKADLWRYCILYKYGGIYVDVDTICLNNLDIFIRDYSFVVPIDLNLSDSEGKHNLSNGFIASVPNSEILLFAINNIVNNVLSGIVPSSKLDFTGPGVVGHSVNKYLNLPETESFVGKEGIINNIHFLKFDPDTEYVRTLNNEILFQNKNKNSEIIKYYSQECMKVKTVDWVYASEYIKKEIVLMVYGEFRTWNLNLEANLNELRELFEKYYVNVFILTQKNSNTYSIENERNIISTFNKFGASVCFVKYIEDFDLSMEIINESNYNTFCKHSRGKHPFVANLLYRRYLLNKCTNEYVSEKSLVIFKYFYIRLFDMKIVLRNNLFITSVENDHGICGSHDTFYYGTSAQIEFLFSFGEKLILYHDDIWTKEFTDYLCSFDCCLGTLKHTYSPEVQYAAHLYFNSTWNNTSTLNNTSTEYKNIRYDYNKGDNNTTDLFNITHCIYRLNPELENCVEHIKNNYSRHSLEYSDIHEHLPTLYKYSLECNSIFETGVRGCVSSWAFAYALINNNGTKKRYLLNDITDCSSNIKLLYDLCKKVGIDISTEWCSNLELQFNETFDLTFIDTWHVYGQLKRELAKFSRITNKYIIMHDTTVDEWLGENIRLGLNDEDCSLKSGIPIEEIRKGLWPAISEFVLEHPEWIIHERLTNNNGLTILKKI